jgi:hypothetical protein
VADRAATILIRLGRAWQRLSPARRGAALAAGLLFVTLMLPWYSTTVTGTGRHLIAHPSTEMLTAWEAFSLIEAAVLIIAVAVLLLLFKRAEGRVRHLPDVDGTIITAAGLCACALIVWRIFAHHGTSGRGALLSHAGIEWGIFVAMLAAAGLAYAGTRIRAAGRSGPAVVSADEAIFDGRWTEPIRASASARVAESTPAADATPTADATPAADAAPVPNATPAADATQTTKATPATASRRAQERRARSSWRPAESPAWSDDADAPWREPERPIGWLTADPPPPPASSVDGAPDGGPEQLTIPFDADGR